MARNRNYQITKRWNVQKEVKPFETTLFSTNFAKLLAQRGLKSEAEVLDFIKPKYEALSDPFDLPDMQQAVDVILAVVKTGEKIAIYGDYDVDGITATAVLADFFRKIGVETVNYIPSRVDEGYGLNTDALKQLAKEGVKLVITVDCGSTSIDVIKDANELGLSVVVTDHHVLKEEKGKIVLPPSAAVVNPKRLPTSSPLYELAGVAVAFYLVRALMTNFKENYALGQEKWLLDLVALGTICDVVPLTGENRILAKYGLSVLSKTKRIGLVTLAKIAEVSLEFVDSYKVGFLLGPRLNAAGRIEHAKAALSLILTDDKDEAEKLAVALDELNKYRQELTEKIVTEAREMIEKDGKKQKIYLLSSKHWPAGVVGIVASRLAEEYGRPMLIMEEVGDELKGSARSIKSFNIIEALTEAGELFTNFGGHAFAAGFKLDKDKFILLNEKLIAIAGKKITEEDLQPEINVDLTIDNKDIDQKFIEELTLLEPYGRENGKPLFLIQKAKIAEARLVGTPAVHLKLKIQQGATPLAGIAFGYGEKLDLNVGDLYDLVVTVEINEWNNRKTPEFRLIDLMKSGKL